MTSIAEDPAVALVAPPAPAWAVRDEVSEDASYHDTPGPWAFVEWFGVERSSGAVSVCLVKTIVLHLPDGSVYLEDISVQVTLNDGPGATSFHVPAADLPGLFSALAAVDDEIRGVLS